MPNQNKSPLGARPKAAKPAAKPKPRVYKQAAPAVLTSTGREPEKVETALVGVTLWRLREPKKTDGEDTRMLVHRPAYDDWTFPKGKLEPGECEPEAALREVEEETGLRCLLGRELGHTEYVDSHGRPKTARYWSMVAPGGEPMQIAEEPVTGEWIGAVAFPDNGNGGHGRSPAATLGT